MSNKEKRFRQKYSKIFLLIFMVSLVTPLTVYGAEEKKPEPNVLSTAASKLRIDGYLQGQFSTSSVEDAVNSSFEMRRARVGVQPQFTDWLRGRIQVDAASSTSILRDAYLDLGFSDGFELRIGQYKKPFSRLQLLSSSVFPMVERGLRIRGIDQPALDDLQEDLRFSERDIGIMAFGRFKDAVGKDTGISYSIGVFNGEGRNRADINDGKQVSGRIVIAPAKGLEFAFSASNNTLNGDPLTDDEGNPIDSTNVQAYEFDVQYRPSSSSGIWIIGEIGFGDNFDEGTGGFLEDEDSPTFTGYTAIVAYRYPVTTNKWLIAVEPVFRFDFTDPDTDFDNDGATLITPGVNLYFHQSVRLMFNYDIINFQDDRDTESAFQFRAQYIY